MVEKKELVSSEEVGTAAISSEIQTLSSQMEKQKDQGASLTQEISSLNLQDPKEEERKAFTQANFDFWKTKAADLANGVPDDNVMLQDDDPSYSFEEITIIMRLLDETIAEAALLRSSEDCPKPLNVAIELGAGTGRITPFLAARASHLTAIEFVPEFTDRNSAKCAAKGILNVTCITADARETKNLPASIDLAFVKWILMYLIDDDAKALLAQIVERLTPGGVLFINESCAPEGIDASLHVDQNYIANYRPITWYKKHLEAIGGGTFTLTTVLDEAIYKKYLEKVGNGHSYPIIRFIKNAPQVANHSGLNPEDSKQEEKKDIASISFDFWKSKAEVLDQGVPEENVMILDDDASYSKDEITFIMQILDETMADALQLRSTESGPKPFEIGLELAAGVGRITPFLAARAGHLTAIEFVPEFAARNTAKCASKGIRNVTVITADARDEQNFPASIDLAFVKWILMYLTDEDVLALLARIIERLTPGGVLLINESCAESGLDPLYFDNNNKYIANYRPVTWYKNQLEALGGGTFKLNKVLDETVYKKYIEESGSYAPSYPIIQFIKNAQ